MHLNQNFLKTIEANLIFPTCCVKYNETMAIRYIKQLQRLTLRQTFLDPRMDSNSDIQLHYYLGHLFMFMWT